MLVPCRTLAYLNAEDLEEIQEKWYELRDYPMKPGDEGWDRMDYGEILKVKAVQDLAEYCDHSDYNNHLIFMVESHHLYRQYHLILYLDYNI